MALPSSQPINEDIRQRVLNLGSKSKKAYYQKKNHISLIMKF
jgi:hypothetical protein